MIELDAKIVSEKVEKKNGTLSDEVSMPLLIIYPQARTSGTWDAIAGFFVIFF